MNGFVETATIEDKEIIAALWRKEQKESGLLGGLIMGGLLDAIKQYRVNVFRASDRTILGFVEYRKRQRDSVTVVYHIAVGKEFRGQRVGQRLLNSLSLPIFLKVTSDNENAIHFYERYGMIRIRESNASTGRKLYEYERLK